MRYLCFLRAYNDVDNIAPVLHFALSAQADLEIDIIIYSQDFDFRANENLAFLARTHAQRVRIRWIGTWLGLDTERYFDASLQGRLYRIWQQQRHNTPNDLMDARSAFSAARRESIFRDILQTADAPTLAIFDLNRCPQLSGAIQVLRQLGVPRIVTLPVSPHINANTFRSQRFVKPEFKLIESLADYQCYDQVAVSNDDFLRSNAAMYALFGQRFGIDHVYALGSVRFLPEWLTIRQQFYEPYPIQGEHTRMVFFLSQPNANSLWDEVQHVLNFIAYFPQFQVIVKPHTRPIKGQPGIQLPAAHITLDRETQSSALIDWADIVLVWGSSIALEAFLKDKTVLVFDYLHINRNLYAEFDAGWVLRCRDDLFEALTRLNQNPAYRPYDAAGVQAMLRHIVYAHTDDPIARHRAFLRGDVIEATSLVV